MTSWWDQTDPTDRPELTNRAPIGLLGSWWNVLVGGAMLLGAPVIVLSGGFDAAHIAFALFLLAVMVAFELVALRKLVQRIAGRRALRAERDAEMQEQEQEQQQEQQQERE
ncbi:hypothetical protein [Curtobacterium sp. ER1/6]|uniref:hypothetical protein n=1 Tax=Curtobacterium sp. ER1/6 TaxID=1891920 RepID=UPI00084F97C2|nr:hypothetical protein [Curtobacterium sp. ER1/6]